MLASLQLQVREVRRTLELHLPISVDSAFGAAPQRRRSRPASSHEGHAAPPGERALRVVAGEPGRGQAAAHRRVAHAHRPGVPELPPEDGAVGADAVAPALRRVAERRRVRRVRRVAAERPERAERQRAVAVAAGEARARRAPRGPAGPEARGHARLAAADEAEAPRRRPGAAGPHARAVDQVLQQRADRLRVRLPLRGGEAARGGDDDGDAAPRRRVRAAAQPRDRHLRRAPEHREAVRPLRGVDEPRRAQRHALRLPAAHGPVGARRRRLRRRGRRRAAGQGHGPRLHGALVRDVAHGRPGAAAFRPRRPRARRGRGHARGRPEEDEARGPAPRQQRPLPPQGELPRVEHAVPARPRPGAALPAPRGRAARAALLRALDALRGGVRARARGRAVPPRHRRPPRRGAGEARGAQRGLRRAVGDEPGARGAARGPGPGADAREGEGREGRQVVAEEARRQGRRPRARVLREPRAGRAGAGQLRGADRAEEDLGPQPESRRRPRRRAAAAVHRPGDGDPPVHGRGRRRRGRRPHRGARDALRRRLRLQGQPGLQLGEEEQAPEHARGRELDAASPAAPQRLRQPLPASVPGRADGAPRRRAVGGLGAAGRRAQGPPGARPAPRRRRKEIRRLHHGEAPALRVRAQRARGAADAPDQGPRRARRGPVPRARERRARREGAPGRRGPRAPPALPAPAALLHGLPTTALRRPRPGDEVPPGRREVRRADAARRAPPAAPRLRAFVRPEIEGGGGRRGLRGVDGGPPRLRREPAARVLAGQGRRRGRGEEAQAQEAQEQGPRRRPAVLQPERRRSRRGRPVLHGAHPELRRHVRGLQGAFGRRVRGAARPRRGRLRGHPRRLPVAAGQGAPGLLRRDPAGRGPGPRRRLRAPRAPPRPRRRRPHGARGRGHAHVLGPPRDAAHGPHAVAGPRAAEKRRLDREGGDALRVGCPARRRPRAPRQVLAPGEARAPRPVARGAGDGAAARAAPHAAHRRRVAGDARVADQARAPRVPPGRRADPRRRVLAPGRLLLRRVRGARPGPLQARRRRPAGRDVPLQALARALRHPGHGRAPPPRRAHGGGLPQRHPRPDRAARGARGDAPRRRQPVRGGDGGLLRREGRRRARAGSHALRARRGRRRERVPRRLRGGRGAHVRGEPRGRRDRVAGLRGHALDGAPAPRRGPRAGEGRRRRLLRVDGVPREPEPLAPAALARGAPQVGELV
ncbi:expressed protein, partial [Aureococcus anophagefferens]